MFYTILFILYILVYFVYFVYIYILYIFVHFVYFVLFVYVVYYCQVEVKNKTTRPRTRLRTPFRRPLRTFLRTRPCEHRFRRPLLALELRRCLIDQNKYKLCMKSQLINIKTKNKIIVSQSNQPLNFIRIYQIICPIIPKPANEPS